MLSLCLLDQYSFLMSSFLELTLSKTSWGLCRYDQAADALRREIGLHEQSEHLPPIGRLAVALVLVQLARGDYVAAEKAFKEWGNCCEAPEVYCNCNCMNV